MALFFHFYCICSDIAAYPHLITIQAVTVRSFLFLALDTGHYNQAIATVVNVDVGAAIMTFVAAFVHARAPPTSKENSEVV